MQAVGSNAASSPAPCQLASMKNDAELGTAINLEAAVVVGRLQVAEVKLVALVRVGRGVNDARRRRSPQARAQAIGQAEIRYVVRGEGKLQPVRSQLARPHERSPIPTAPLHPRLPPPHLFHTT